MGRNFFPGSSVHPVPGIGTFAMIAVASGRGSEGVQIQFMPDGGSECLPGHMSFGLRIEDDRTYTTEFRGSTISATFTGPLIELDPSVLAAAKHVAEDRAANDRGYVLFNLIADAAKGIREIEQFVDLAVGRSSWAKKTYEKESALVGSNEPPTFTAEQCAERERKAVEMVETTAPRLAMLKTLRRDLIDWTHAKAATKPDLFDLIRDRDAFPPGENDPSIAF